MAKRTYRRTCYFCKKPVALGDKAKYVYPLPARCKAHIHEGAYACPKCYPAVLAELQAEGQLLMESKSL